jgi:hypothetical protein
MALIRNNGFVQLRRGLFEHVSSGQMTTMECFLYTAILANADPSTGIWDSCAGVMSGLYNIPIRTCRDYLEKLEKKGYLKRFTVPGKHGQYPIFVHQFECTDGALKGKRLNAIKSKSYDNPVYEFCEDGVEDGVEDGAAKYLDNKRIEKKNLSAKVKPSRVKEPTLLSIFRQDLDAYYLHKTEKPAPWDGKEAARLSGWMRANPTITRDEWRRILTNRARSPVAHAVPTSVWINRAVSWLNGPADEWGKSLTGGNTGNGKGNHSNSAELADAYLRESFREYDGINENADQTSSGTAGHDARQASEPGCTGGMVAKPRTVQSPATDASIHDSRGDTRSVAFGGKSGELDF